MPFNLFINDLPSVIKHSNFLLCADDFDIFKVIGKINDSHERQLDLNSIHEWCSVNNLEVDIKRYFTITFSTPCSQEILSTIHRVNQMRYVGVDFDSKTTTNATLLILLISL